MSTLSANTLFHFTRNKDTLINILKTRFYPRLCLEEIIIGTKSAKIAFPMVCFCDIPLSQIGNHASTYGKYAIGLKKEWAIKNGITPILYTHSTSLLCDNLRENLNDVKGKKFDNLLFNLIYTAGFIKPYSSSLSIKKKKIQVINYNEREWRYIPPKNILLSKIVDDVPPPIIIEDEFKEPSISALNTKLEQYGLDFVPNDINYIIVEKETEILEIIDAVQQIKGNYSHNAVKLLSTRIISMERIAEDFW